MTDSSAALLAALETSWEIVQGRHPELPAVTITAGRTVRRDALRWSVRDSVTAQETTSVVSSEPPELRIADATLEAGPTAVITTLLHQATHAASALRGIRDTTNRGKWHNKLFRQVAAEFGLTWPEGRERDLVRGFGEVVMTPETETAYQPLAVALADALETWQHDAKKAAGAAPARTRTDSRLSLTCRCGRKAYMSRVQYAQGGITCHVCGQPFQET